jgi:uncharacterized protein YsxB (DUF464 family)
MITVTFYKFGDLICGFKSSGHSGYARQGSDIVCSAVSSAVIMAVNTITDVQHINADVTVGEGFLELKLSLDEAQKSSDILNGLQLHLNALEEQYKDFLKLKFSEV